MIEQVQLDFEALVKGSELTREERLVWEAVQPRRGKENAILGPMISAMTEIEYNRIREIISHLIKRHGRLIASYSRGYFIPITPEEVMEATRSLRHRGIMILVRASKLQRISLEEIFHQAKMEFNNEAN